MERRGFTLIELLGVIVIIGILVLITTPIIMNTIENSRKSSAIRSAEQVIRTATISYSTNDNFTTDKQDVLSLDLSGKKPESGYIQFDENEKVRFYMVYSGYCVVKRYDSELEAFKMDEVGICDWYTSSKTIRLETTDSVLTVDDLEPSNLLNYRIYGNSVANDIFVENLPPEYQQVEYIQSTGTQYIDTGIYASENNSFEVKAQLVHTDNTSQTVWGGRNSSTANQLQGNQLSFVKSSSHYQFISGDTNVASETWDTNLHIFYANKNKLYIDNRLVYTVQSAPITSKNNVYIFTTNTAGDVGFNGGSLKIYYFKIWSGDTLVRDFIPCYRKEDNVVGMYDLVEGKFYENKGTGSFVKGLNLESAYSLGNYNPKTEEYEIPVTVTGKNLFDLNSAIISGAAIEDDTVVANANSINIDIYLKKGTYSIMFNTSKSNVYLRKGQVSSGYFADISSGNVARFTFEEDQYLRISYFGVGGTISNIMLVEGSYTKDTMPEYEPYSSKTYSIYLDEPLRCVGDVCDYIDYDDGVVVRKIKEIDSSGEKTIEESFEILSTPKNKKIDLPEIKTLDGTNNITVTGGNVSASKIEVVATKK